MTPEEKLCSRSWRLKNSAGVLWPILSMGMLGCVVFLMRGIKSKTTWWWVMGIGFAVFEVALMISGSFIDSGTKQNPSNTPESKVQGGLLVLNWVASSVMAFVINKKWLLWKAHNGQAWYAAAHQGANGAAQPVQFGAPSLGKGPAGVAHQAYPFGGTSLQQTNGAVTAVDINRASMADLQGLGLEATAASRLIQTRDQHNGFPNFEQMVAAAGIPPHQLLAIRDRLAFGVMDARPEPSRRLFD
jgi:DNA uptake protein ComE-like DNA-binding protein